ncbi:MAG: tetratricopeptide repeat protein [Deltaproteobacteria bacterium]|nr:tetratricopeptide repeat protein [Deltaproteobacteria bacterium]
MSKPERETYYEILQVHPRASQTVIQGAYRALLKSGKIHPDLGGSDEETKRINEAYAALIHPERRQEYDQWLAQQQAQSQARAPVREGRRDPANRGDAPGSFTLARTQYILICPACRQRNLVSDPGALSQTRCGSCGESLQPRRRMPVEKDHAKAFRVGLLLFEKGLLPRARAELLSAAKLQPRNAHYQYWLGRCQYHMRVFEQARQAFGAAAHLHPQQFHFQFWLGQTLYMMKDYLPALERFEAAARLRAGHSPTRLRLASCCLRLGRHTQAVTVLEDAAQRDPGRPELLRLLGSALLAGGNPQAARNVFSRVLELLPEDPVARKHLKRLG